MTGTSESRKARKESWVMPALFGLIVTVLLIGGWWYLSHMKGGEGPRRQVAKIALLPDTPPPPPPPKEEKKPEPPKDEPKQVVHEEQIKQAEAPKAPEPIKMEGAAGEGNSAFAVGGVKNEYSGGTPVTGASTGGTGTSSDRAQERFFANTVRQQLRDEIERRLKGDADQMTASFSIWLARDGAIERYELQSSGNEGNDTALRAALDETVRQFKLPPPPAIAQPMRFRLNVRPQA